jgi:hypothetical protein
LFHSIRILMFAKQLKNCYWFYGCE